MAKQKKVYLVPAAHAVDNKTACPIPCSENTHCNQYMDIVEKRLGECGILTKRPPKDWVGDAGAKKRVQEANRWGADLCYAAHTNAGGGRYSMTMCWKDAASKAAAARFGAYRKCVHSHKVVDRPDLYEIRATKMLCLYDELFFHDNAEDCAWFHNGGMELMAEEAVQALCAELGVPYQAPVTEPKKENTGEPVAPAAGAEVKLEKGKLYTSSTGDKHVTRTGTFWLYDGKKVNGRYRVTNKPERVGKKPIGTYVSGWVKM